MPAKSVSVFRTELMVEFGLAEDNDNEGTSPEAILKYINEANALFINHRAWSFRLKHRTQFIYPSATVNTDFDASDTQAVLSSTVDWGAVGRIFCDYDIIEFTANDNVNTLNIVQANVDRLHETGEQVLLMYEVPADYNKISVMHVKDTLYLKEDQRVNKTPPSRMFWEIEVKLSNGSSKKYLVFPYRTSKEKIYFMYGFKATDFETVDLDLTTTFVEVPEPYWDFINRRVSGRIYRHLEELSLAKEQEAEADKILLKAAIFDSKQHFGNKVPLRTEWDNPRKNLGIGSYRNLR